MTRYLVLESSRSRAFIRALKAHLFLLFSLLGIMWVIEFLDLLPFFESDGFGIQPRSTSGLPGIVLAPFLHSGFGHLIVNTLPFVILGGIVLLGGLRMFWRVTVFVTLVGGLCVWLFAGSFSNHLGASGLIFGYLGFIIARGCFERSLPWLLIACAILIGYGGLLIGVLPLQTGVSWQAHLFGLLAGIGAARLMFPRGRILLR